MPTIKCFGPVSGDVWRETIATFRGNPFHAPEVLSLESPVENIVHLHLAEGGKTTGVAIAAVNRTRRLRVLPGGRELYLPTVPASAGRYDHPDGLEEMAAALVQFAEEKGCCRIRVGLRWGADFSGSRLFGSSITRRIREFTVDLAPQEDEILGQMHKKHRKNIRQAGEAGIEVAVRNDVESLLTLRDLQGHSAERNTARGNPFSAHGAKEYLKIYETVYAKGIGRVHTAMIGGEAVAALASLAYGRRAITVRSGATRRGYESHAMYLLQYRLIADLKREGCEVLNIGGVPFEAVDPGHPQHGLYLFKKYFGGEEHVRSEVDQRVE